MWIVVFAEPAFRSDVDLSKSISDANVNKYAKLFITVLTLQVLVLFTLK